ncbi:MAG: DUF2116 family Zn-ribbon domain-containing protein [Oscillospiraceae bacterium]|nr:DUF2116 family Zn-ribbon domain-containing protein [Oscillospiraceae bacterium]
MNKNREPTLNNRETLPDLCVCCGAPVPEGTMVCWDCQHKYDKRRKRYILHIPTHWRIKIGKSGRRRNK